MRSPGNPRRAAERALRGLVLAMLAWRLVLALRGPAPGSIEVAHSAGLRSALVRWSTVASPARVHVALDYPPTEVDRDWLAALPATGTTAAWSGPNLLPTALTVLPLADPTGGADLLIAAPRDARVIVGDTATRADTTRVGGFAARVHLPRPGSVMEAAVGPVRARGTLQDSLDLRRLLVLGSAGWESKFIITALEERGWTVDAHLVVAPGGDVAQGALVGLGRPLTPVPASAPAPPASNLGAGPPFGGQIARATTASAVVASAPAPTPPRLPKLGVIDTARYAAVIAVDSTAAREALRITRFVRSGGGLLITAAAAEASALQPLAPAHAGPIAGEEGRALTVAAKRDALPFRPLLDLKPNAVILERHGTQPVAVALRDGPGRIAEIGGLELWRWRMAGGDRGADEHRAWLARLVAGVAYTPRHSLDAPSLDPAPLATLVDHLGPAIQSGPPPSRPNADRLLPWVFALLCGALLLEWLSRRLRSRP